MLTRAAEILDQPGARRTLSIEGLRGVAVALVFLVHYFAVFGGLWSAGAVARLAATAGHYGVDLFFLISGYLIYGALLRGPTPYGRFVKRRIQRLYPAFTAVFCAYLALSFLVPGESKLPPGRGDLLLYVAENYLLLPGLLPIEPMITVAWSLSFEVFFYLALPLCVGALRLRERPPGTRMACVLAAGTVLFAITAACDASMHARMLMFVAGMALVEWRSVARTASARAHRLALHLALASIPVGLVLETAGVLGSLALYVRILWLALVLPVVGASAFSGAGPLAAALSWRPLRWLGNMSYSYYLLHGLALKGMGLVAARLLPGAGAAAWWLFLPLAFGGTVVASFVLYALVEHPLSIARAAGSAAAPAVPRPVVPRSRAA